MPSAYILANVDVRDPAAYEEYKRLSTIAMKAHGAEVCVRGGKVEVLEGDWTPNRVVLLKDLPAEGSIVAYNAPFETARIVECAEALPKYRQQLNALLPRFRCRARHSLRP